MVKIKKYLFIIAIILITSFTFAEEIDENAMFADVETIEAETQKVVDNPLNVEEDKKSVALTGGLNSYSTYSATRDNLEGKGRTKDNTFDNYISANLLLDIRLKNNIKGFGNVQLDYFPQGTTENQKFKILGADISVENKVNAKYSLKELFIDANYNKKAYFRFGKQVLQWGRGYLWNPTDMINIDRKKFDSNAGYREGAYGLKMHIPFGTKLNIYSFFDVSNTENIEELAPAAKVEFLVGNTEMAFSAWTKKDKRSVFGYDISSRIGQFDIWGETSLSYGDNAEKVKIVNNEYVIYKESDKIIPKISVGTSKSFDIKDEKERFSIVGEFYYNGSGFDKNILSDTKTRDTYVEYDTLKADSSDNYNITKSTVTTRAPITIAEYIFNKGLYSPNDMSKYYAATFMTYKKFIISDMNLNMNVIGNLVDGSMMINPYLSYSNLSDLSISFGVTGFAGDKNCEYTINGKGLETTLSAGITF